MIQIPNWLWKLILSKGLFVVALLALERPASWLYRGTDLEMLVAGSLVLLIAGTVLGLLWHIWNPELKMIAASRTFSL
jgi:hypothetical protein